MLLQPQHSHIHVQHKTAQRRSLFQGQDKPTENQIPVHALMNQQWEPHDF